MPENGLLENFIKALQYECAIYQGLLKIAEKKTDCLINNDITALLALVEEEKKAAAQTSQLNSVREQLLTKYCKQTGQDFKNMTLQKLARQVPEPYNKQLADIRAKISDAVAKLSSRNDLNRQLTDNGMKYIDFSLQLISSSGPETPVYGSSGQEVLNGPKRNMLDIKY